jgi:hypothetical protein
MNRHINVLSIGDLPLFIVPCHARAAEGLLGAGTAAEGETPPAEHLPLLLGVGTAASTCTPNRRTALWEYAGAQRNKSLANANVVALEEQQTHGIPSSSGAGGGPTAGYIHKCKQSNALPRALPAGGSADPPCAQSCNTRRTHDQKFNHHNVQKLQILIPEHNIASCGTWTQVELLPFPKNLRRNREKTM